jgi:NADH-quinone oxidoreductase subunit K
MTLLNVQQATNSRKGEPTMLQTEWFIMVSMILFLLGTMGILLRRNAILMFMSVELMLNAANLALVAFAQRWNNADGHLFVFFVITVAAAEVAIGLALIVAIYRTKHSINIDQMNQMEG